MFASLQMAPPDAILGLTEAFNNDPNPRKINLSVGVYKDAEGQTPILPAVKEAERRLLQDETNKSYLGMVGIPEFGQHVQALAFDAEHDIVRRGRAVTAQTPGGTGALRVAGDFIKQKLGGKRIWCSNPTWANHPAVFAAAGLTVDSYTYLDATGTTLDFDGMMNSLKKIPAGDVICLHACCHNPTGIDPTPEQWQQIAHVLKQQGVLPLVDFAYQGFAQGLEEDARGVRELAAGVDEMLLCSSFSKNFGLYGERVGALTLVADSQQAAQVALSHMKLTIRTNYSNPPKHGGAIVTTVLSDPDLRLEWKHSLDAMRERIVGVRQLFCDTMQAKGVQRDFSYLVQQHGMFSLSGLSPEQVTRLRDEYSIYIVGSGRINVAGMTKSNMDRLCDAVAAVL